MVFVKVKAPQQREKIEIWDRNMTPESYGLSFIANICGLLLDKLDKETF